ncbi:MAG: hypothetical protein F4X11_22880 [Acidobacteria bacterium]|nr:hypothetical protein [Acidobacteriota bacterium]
MLGHLPERMHASVGRALRTAWDLQSEATAKRALERLARSLEDEHPGAAASIREGLDETLTVLRPRLPRHTAGGPHRRLRRRPGRPRPRRRRRAGAGHGHGRRRPRTGDPRQPRREAGPRARRPQRRTQARTDADARAARRDAG